MSHVGSPLLPTIVRNSTISIPGVVYLRPTIHFIGYAHIDPVYMWQWPEGYAAARATFRSVLDRMKETPEFVFTTTTSALMEMVERGDPGLFREIQARVAEGRWILAGGWWVEPDCNLVHGESLVRQALYGQRYLQSRFGAKATVGMNPDTFGHAWTIPQILRKSGATNYVFMRPAPYEKGLPDNVFWWEGPDGSRVLAVRLRSYSEAASDEEIADMAHGEFYSTENRIFFYGVGNHGGGPTKASIANILRWRETGEVEGVFSDPERFFAAVAKEREFPVVKDELQHHARGCYSTVPELKRLNRRAEHTLMIAERFAAIAHKVASLSYPNDELQRAWKDVLFLQCHDILTGTCPPEAVEDATHQYGRAIQTAEEVLNFSIQAICSRIDTRGEGTPLVVFNPSLWERKGPVEVTVDIRHWGRKNSTSSLFWWREGSLRLVDANGTGIPVQLVPLTGYDGGCSRVRILFNGEVPSLGYKVYYLADDKSAEPANKVRVLENRLENAWWVLELDPQTGWITRLFDKKSDVEVLSGPANVPLVLEDKSDTWAHEVESFNDVGGRFTVAEITVLESGPVRGTILVRSQFEKSTLEQRISLYSDSPVIECVATVNWQEQARMLKVEFLFNVIEPEVTYEIPYGAISRESKSGEEPGGKWIDVSGHARTPDGCEEPYGVALFNDSKHGFDVWARMRRYKWGPGKARVRVSILRSPIFAFHEPNEPQEGIPYRYQSQGLHTYRLAILPHRGNWRDETIQRQAEAFNEPFIAVNEFTHEGPLPPVGSFASVRPDNVVATVLKRAEEGDGYIVRCYESAGKVTKGTIEMPFIGTKWDFEIGPNEIKTFKSSEGNPILVAEANLLEEV
ncbi:MAG: glycoside hydrolase family 38 C-terminal domain-containing protein [Bacillota bacterium]